MSEIEPTHSAPAAGRQPHSAWIIVPLCAAALAVLALPFVSHTTAQTPAQGTATVATTASGTRIKADIRPSDDDLGKFLNNNTGSQVSYTRLSDGFHTGSANERFTRPALSLAKLYIADEVFRSGNERQQRLASEMIRTSDDAIAEELYREFPDSIDQTAARYSLYSTRSDGENRWGYSVTSAYDLVSFISQKIQEDPHDPLLNAMRSAAPVAADGYAQNYGTATLKGAQGTKWGWSNDHTLNSSVTFGADFVAAAAVAGSAEDLTNLVKQQLTQVNSAAP